MNAYHLSALILVSVCVCFAEKNSQLHNQEISPRMVLVGTVDGKSYYAERKFGNWTQARTHCNDNDMEMASITSKEQLGFLLGAYNYPNFHGYYWLSGRDAMDVAQLVWDNDNSTLDSSFISLRYKPQMLQCLDIFLEETAEGINSYLSSHHCSVTLTQVLCQVQH